MTMAPREELDLTFDGDEFPEEGQDLFDRKDEKPSGAQQARHFLDWAIRALFFPAIISLWVTVHNVDKDVSYIRGQIDVMLKNPAGTQGTAVGSTTDIGKPGNETILAKYSLDPIQGPPRINHPQH